MCKPDSKMTLLSILLKQKLGILEAMILNMKMNRPQFKHLRVVKVKRSEQQGSAFSNIEMKINRRRAALGKKKNNFRSQRVSFIIISIKRNGAFKAPSRLENES